MSARYPQSVSLLDVRDRPRQLLFDKKLAAGLRKRERPIFQIVLLDSLAPMIASVSSFKFVHDFVSEFEYSAISNLLTHI